MWDLVLINETGGFYIVMTPNGDTHCIDEVTYNKFLNENRINYGKKD
jgi:hypothetical protein